MRYTTNNVSTCKSTAQSKQPEPNSPHSGKKKLFSFSGFNYITFFFSLWGVDVISILGVLNQQELLLHFIRLQYVISWSGCCESWAFSAILLTIVQQQVSLVFLDLSPEFGESIWTVMNRQNTHRSPHLCICWAGHWWPLSSYKHTFSCVHTLIRIYTHIYIHII